MKIALKLNDFDDWEVAPKITLLNRGEVAEMLLKDSYLMEVVPGATAYETYERITGLLKADPKRIIRLDTGVREQFFLYKKHLHVKHIPTMIIEEVDVKRPWMIVPGVPEQIVYTELTDNNQVCFYAPY